MKQTAVEWLVEEISFLKDMNFDFGDGLPKDIIDKAKEMENLQKLKYQLFIDKVIEIIGDETIELLKECNETYKSE